MTVINMLSLKGREGLAIADEQSSSSIRKYNVTQKLKILPGNIVYGGSGPTDHLADVYSLAAEKLESKGGYSMRQVHELVNNEVINYNHMLIDNYLRARFGFGRNEFNTGTLGATGGRIDVQILEGASRAVGQLAENTTSSILLGGVNGDGFEIYEVSSNGVAGKTARKYGSIGSGADESDKVLSSYVTSLPRDDRDFIGREDGLAILVEATIASSRINNGVGGIPSIIYVSEDGASILEEDKSILTGEIIQGLDADLLDEDHTYELLGNLVFGDSTFEEVESGMKNQAKDWNKLDRLLRGYKV